MSEGQFLAGTLIYKGLFTAAGVGRVVPARRFQQLYLQRVDPQSPFFSRAGAKVLFLRYSVSRWRWLVEDPRVLWRTLRLYHQPQTDRDVEAARLRFVRWERARFAIWLAWLVFMLVQFAIVLVSSLSR